nr:825_t:CDS:2 [Entrophospora candida]
MEKQNIFAKLQLIQTEIKELIRTEENKFQKYKFFNELQVLQLLKPLLNKYKLTILLSDDISQPFIHEREGKEHFVKYLKRLAIIDIEEPKDKLFFNFWACGSNVDLAKAKGSAETYALKYFLSKLFLMPVKDEGDPDYQPHKEKEETTPEEREVVKKFLKERGWNKEGEKGIVEFEINNAYFCGLRGDDSVIKGGDDIKVGIGNIKANAVKGIRVETNFKEAARLAHLARFRGSGGLVDSTVGSGDNIKDKKVSVILLKGVIAGTDDNTFPVINGETDIITLNDDNFAGGFSFRDNLDINVFPNGGGTDAADFVMDPAGDLSASRTVLENIGKVLEDIEEKIMESEVNSTLPIDFQKVKAADNISIEAKIYALDNVPSVKKDGSSEDGGTFYKFIIEAGKKTLSEILIWRESGFETIGEILRANANGFIIWSRNLGDATTNVNFGDSTHKGLLVETDDDGVDVPDAKTNVIEVKRLIQNKKYRGFEMIDNSTQMIGKSDNGDGVLGEDVSGKLYLCFSGMAAKPLSKDSRKENIDIFRKLFTNDSESTPEKCRGFQPGDIFEDTTDANSLKYKLGDNTSKRVEKLVDKISVKKNNGKDVSGTDMLPTKHFFDIADKVKGKGTDDEKYTEAVKVAFHDAGFEETDSADKLVDLLDLYAHQARGLIKYSDKQTDFDAEYEKTKKVLELVKVDYSKSNSSVTDTQAKEAKAKLEAAKTEFPGLEKTWIKKKLEEISGRTGDKTLDQKIDDEIVKYTDASSNAYKAYKAFKDLTDSDDNRTEAIFDQLKILVGLLKDANVTKTSLNPFKNDAAATSPKGDNQELKNAKEDLRQAVKTAINKEDDATINKIIEGFETDVKKIKRVTTIIKEANKGKGKTSGEAALKVRENDADIKGYVEKILEELGKSEAKIKKFINDKIKNANTKESLDEIKQELESNTELDATEKGKIKEKAIPRKYLLIELKDKTSTEEEGLKDLIKHFLDKVDLNTDGDYCSNDKKDALKTKLTGLEKYQASGSNSSVYNSLSQEGKGTVDKLIKEVRERISKMEENDRHDNPNNSPEPNF